MSIHWQNGVVARLRIGWRGALFMAAAILMLAMPAGASQAASVTARGRAVALEGPPGNMCLMALQASGKLSIGSVDFTGKPTVCLGPDATYCPGFPSQYSCDVYNDSQSSDSTDVSGNAAIIAHSYHLSGGYSIDNNSVMETTGGGKVATYVPQVPDPYAGYTIPSYSGCNQGSLSSGWTVQSNTTLTNGGSTPYVICGGLTVNAGATLNLNPGVYVIDFGSNGSGSFHVNGNATVTGSGVTIILTSSVSPSDIGVVQFDGGSNINLSAPTSGPTAGVALWVDRNAPTGNTDTMNGGSTQVINGAIYLPSQQANYNGGAMAGTNCSQLVALTIQFSGNPIFAHDCQGAGTRDPLGPPKLVE